MPSILVIQHQDDCPPGRFGEWLVEEGCCLDVRRPDRGESIDLAEEHSGIVVLGGSPNAHDHEAAPWLPAVDVLCRNALQREVPLLGICLGHQLLADAVGGRSVRNPHGQQIGVLRLGWTAEAGDDPLLGALPGRAVQWNNDVVVDLPGSVQVLARAAGGEVQAARFGPAAWGVQSHPEVDAQICAAWVEHDKGAYAGRGAEVVACVEQVRDAEAELVATWRPVATAFVGLTDRWIGGTSRT